jgi:hypothetical protein
LFHKDNFDKTLQLIVTLLAKVRDDCIWDKDMAAPTLWTWCRRGRHRSVAVGTILSEMLRYLGFDVTVEHWMRHWWYCCDGGGKWQWLAA